MEKNGKATASSLSVWKDESTSGLDTIRKILLAKHTQESDQKLAELTNKYEAIFRKMELNLQQKEADFAQKFQFMQEDFQLRFDELKSNFYREIIAVEKKTMKQTNEKNIDFGKVLIQLGKEWTFGKENE